MPQIRKNDFRVGGYVVVNDNILKQYAWMKYSNIPVRIIKLYEGASDFYTVAIPNNSDGGFNVHYSNLRRLLSKKQQMREEVIRQSEIKHKVTLISI